MFAFVKEKEINGGASKLTKTTNESFFGWLFPSKTNKHAYQAPEHFLNVTNANIPAPLHVFFPQKCPKHCSSLRSLETRRQDPRCRFRWSRQYVSPRHFFLFEQKIRLVSPHRTCKLRASRQRFRPGRTTRQRPRKTLSPSPLYSSS